MTRVADGDWVCRSSTTATAINGKGQTIYIVGVSFHLGGGNGEV